MLGTKTWVTEYWAMTVQKSSQKVNREEYLANNAVDKSLVEIYIKSA